MTADKSPNDRACHGCGKPVRSGERLVRVERGEQTPYGMAPADAGGDTRTYYFHERCVPTDLTALTDADADAGG